MNSFHVLLPVLVIVCLSIGFSAMLLMHYRTQRIVLRLESQVEEIDHRTMRNINIIQDLQRAVKVNGSKESSNEFELKR